MKTTKLLLILFMLIMIGNMFAAFINLTVREVQTGPMVTLTRAKILLESPTYGTGTQPPLADRWVIQYYTSPNGVIDPLGTDGLPTGDDFVTAFYNGTSTQKLVFANASTWLTSTIRVYDDGVTGNTWQGDKVYLRIFNSNSIATATKYIQSTALYTLPTGATTLNYIAQRPAVAPDYGWSDWIQKDETPLVSGTISSGLSVSGVTVACTGQTNYTTIASGTFNFSVPRGANITVTPSKSGYSFVPSSRSYNNVQDDIPGVNFVMTKLAPNPATIPVPGNGDLNVPVTVGFIEWDYIAGSGYSLPSEFKVYFPSTAVAPAIVPYAIGTSHYSFPIPLLGYSTTYSWKVVPTNSSKAQDTEVISKSVMASTKDIKGDSGDIVTWAFTTENPNNISPGISEVIDPDGGGTMGNFVFDTPSTDIVPTTPVIIYTIIPLASVPDMIGFEYITSGFAMNLHASGSTSMEVSVPVGRWFVSAYYNGEWHSGTPSPANGPTVVQFTNIPFGAKGDVPIVINKGGDPTLPVELSSFTAVYSVGFFVQLTWVVQSETNHLGYNVLRNESEDLSSATQINRDFLSSGSSAGTQITYNFRDEDVANNSTYYYWLQSVDLDGTSYFFGPVNVLISNNGGPEIPPVIPTVTELLNAYPNPFNPMTTIPYTLKTPGEVRIDVYNVKGQVVWTYNHNHDKAGYYQIPWDGKDNNGKSISSGIYYYRMNSGKYTASKKIILVK